MNKLGLALLATLVTATSACDTSTAGANDVLLFTPRDCGRIGCSFNLSIGTGGLVDVQIDPIGETSTAGITLFADPDFVLDVVPVTDNGQPTWEMLGVSPGIARLIAIDTDGIEVDFLEVVVQDADGLELLPVLGDAVGPDTSNPSYDQVWTINADQAVSFNLAQSIGGETMMGRFVYTATIDQEISDGLINTNDVSEGVLHFQVPVGQYQATFASTSGLTFDALFDAQ